LSAIAGAFNGVIGDLTELANDDEDGFDDRNEYGGNGDYYGEPYQQYQNVVRPDDMSISSSNVESVTHRVRTGLQQQSPSDIRRGQQRRSNNRSNSGRRIPRTHQEGGRQRITKYSRGRDSSSSSSTLPSL